MSASARTVRYGGARLDVPASWPVVHVSGTRCVRFDRHAVYLGAQSARAACPAHLYGQASAVQIQPLTKAPAPPGSVALPRLGLVVTVSGDRRAAARILRSLRASGPARRVGLPARAASAPRSTKPRYAGTGAGRGFDTCAAPSADTMATWKQTSPYSAVGVYVGGANRACSQPNLTAAWVSTVEGQGWGLIPTYVGLQAPCGNVGQKIDPNNAAVQGTQAADDAAAQSAALGLGNGDPVYFDMEAFPTSDANCVNTVKTFLQAWTTELHAKGYTSGVYGSSASTAAVLAQAWGTGYVEPDDLWYANWDGRAQTTGDPYFSDATWPNHQRLHQFQGGHNESYGGATINIDSNALDGAVAQAAPSYSYSLQGVNAYADAGLTRPLNLTTLRAGQDAWVHVTAQNTGAQTWQNAGGAPVRLGTWNPPDHSSLFSTGDWLNPVRAAALNEATVAPGATGTFTAHLHVPVGTRAADERFNLVAEGAGWMGGPGVDVHLQVLAYAWSLGRMRAYSDRGLHHPAARGHLHPGQDLYLAASATNMGWQTWSRTRVSLRSSASHGSLAGTAGIARAIAPGRTVRFVAHLHAPLKPGSYRRRFNLAVAGRGWMPDQNLVVRVRVLHH